MPVHVSSEIGRLRSVIVHTPGPELLAPHAGIAEETREEHRLKVVDVAADSQGRVLVLDPQARLVRVFEQPDRAGQAGSEEGKK